MNRYTKKLDNICTVDANSVISNESGHTGDAIDKLAKFEDVIDELILKQSEISKELKALRNEQKTKSVRFRQLLGNKLTNSALITIFERHGLMDRETDLE